MDTYLQIDKITKSFGTIKALDHFSLSVKADEWFGILGPSGCGKTTLLRIMAGLENADSGSLKLGDTIFFDEGHHSVPPEKRNIGFVFQDLALWPHMTAIENVAFMFHGKMRRKERRERAKELLLSVHLPETHCRNYPDELSGGECQRVAIARALASSPRLLLMDEPFSHLDSGLKQDMFSLMREVRAQNNFTVIYVSHALQELEALVDRVGIVDKGKMEEIQAITDN